MMQFHQNAIGGFDLCGACIFSDAQSFVMRLHTFAEGGTLEENKAMRIVLQVEEPRNHPDGNK